MERTKQQLQVEVGKIQQKVEQVKKLQDTSEKQHQMGLVEKEISALKQEIERSALQDNEKQELLASLDVFSSDLERLKQRVLESSTGKDKEPSNSEPSGFLGKAKGIFLWAVTGISAWSFFKSWKKKDEAEQKAYEKKSWRGKTRDTMKTRGRRVLSGTATFFGVKGLIDYFSTPNQPEQPLQQQETPSQQPAVSGGQESVSVEQKEEEKEEEKTEEKAEKETGEETEKETGEETEKETGEETEGELSHQEQEANAQAERLYSEGYSDWYILVKMYQMGFVPRGFTTPFHWKSIWGKIMYVAEWRFLESAVNKREQFKQWISALITKNNVELTTAKLEAIKTNNLSVQKLCEEQIDVLAKMQGEIKEGKITSLKELEKKYGTELTDKVKMGKRASFSKRAVAAIETEADKILGKAKEIEASEAELKRLQKAAEQKLKDLDTKVKANPQQKAAYQKEAKEIIKQYNRTVVDTERTIGRELSKMSASELTQLQGKSPFVDKMLKANGKVDNFVKKSRAGKLMLGFGLMSLVGKWVSGQVSWEQVGLEAADVWISMVPFAGGAYDVWTSITGEGIAGQLSTTDRVIRGVVGGVSIILDVAGLFSFWAGNAASAGLKGAVKGTTKTVKVVKTVKATAEVASTGIKLATYGFLWYTLLAEVPPMAIALFEGGEKVYEEIDKKLTPDIELSETAS